jgi:hypothetical protein
MQLDDAVRKMGLEAFFNRQDLFWPLYKWPSWARDAILKEHKNNRDRYALFVFLTLNGLPPDIAGHWVLSHHRRGRVGQRGNLVQGIYDDNARRQVFKQMPQQLEDERLCPPKMKIFDMHLRKVVEYQDKSTE